MVHHLAKSASEVVQRWCSWFFVDPRGPGDLHSRLEGGMTEKYFHSFEVMIDALDGQGFENSQHVQAENVLWAAERQARATEALTDALQELLTAVKALSK